MPIPGMSHQPRRQLREGPDLEKQREFLRFVFITRRMFLQTFGLHDRPVHIISNLMDILAMMYNQLPEDIFDLGQLLLFRDVLQTILDTPWDQYPRHMSIAKDVRRRERIPEIGNVWVPHEKFELAREAMVELSEVQGSLWGHNWFEISNLFWSTVMAGNDPDQEHGRTAELYVPELM